MEAAHVLDAIVNANNRGHAVGITSICSANAMVLDAALRQGLEKDQSVLIESTCNQVNQFGGYMGMTPTAFRQYAFQIATTCHYPQDKIIFGGDHLGPNPWQDEPASQAMEKSCTMVRDYVKAGYTKIHLDASMKCLDDDPQQALSKTISAGRAADMALVAEDVCQQMGTAGQQLRYVIGTEVPVPGGTQEYEDTIELTTPDDVAETLEITRQAFSDRGLEAAWERVLAVVVQPGVEFGNDSLFVYESEKAANLSKYIEGHESLIYEAHSTDYQPRQALSNLVRDHFAILKVGPALTFALREAIFALAMIEQEMFLGRMESHSSQVRETLETVMVEQPAYWEKYYPGNDAERLFARKYSFSDRSRYYWPVPNIQSALEKLIHNLETHPIPLTLISQFLPTQYPRVRDRFLENSPKAIIRDKIASILADYTFACNQE